MIKSGQAVTAVFTTHDATTGAAADATGTPTGTLYVNGTADAATVTVTNIATGRYKAAVTLPSLGAGDVVAIGIAATVNGVAGAGVVWSDVADTKRISDLNDVSPAQVNAEADTAISDAALATAAALQTVDNNVDTALTRLTADRAGYLDKLNVTGTLAHSDAANTYKADVSGLALEATAQDILTDTGTTLPGQIAALNNLSQAEAQTAAAAALVAYDPPTYAELMAGLGNITISQQVIEDAVAAALDGASIAAEVDAEALAASVWQNAVRTLTAAAAVGPTEQIDGGDITAHRGDSFHLTLTGLGDLTQRDELWFTVKRSLNDDDNQAQIQMTESAGLLIVARASATTAAHGAMTVTDAATGVVDIDIDEAATALMPADRRMSWDIQMKAGNTVTTLTAGTIQFAADVTRTV